MKHIEEQIALKQKNIEAVDIENEEIKVKVDELNVKYIKEVGDHTNKDQVVLDNKCKKCFMFRNENHYKNISFDHFSEILHEEIMVYLKWLRMKIEVWNQKAEKIINEVIVTIKEAYADATVTLFD